MNILNKIIRFTSLRISASKITRTYHKEIISDNVPVLASLQNVVNPWIWQKNDNIKFPVVRINKIDLPNGLTWVPPCVEPCNTEIQIEEPPNVENDMIKEAVRMIVIRRKKMKKHKLKKLRKRMRFEWGKRRQRRELKKEKEFQAKLIQQYTKAEKFSAEAYVQERIDKLNEIIIPKRWKGKRLPEYLIREKMGLPPNGKITKL